MTPMPTILRKRFRTPPPVVADMFLALAEYRPVPAWPRDCRALAGEIADDDPFTIILFVEPLAQKHWRRTSHMVMRRVELVSELEETVYRHFERELNARMAEWLHDHRDPDDAHLRSIVREYYPKAKRILRADYQERYPRVWRKRWAERSYLQPRPKVECLRRYDLPPPLGLWSTGSPQQFYCLRRSKTYARGCGNSSGSREVHSYFGLAFLELTRCGVSIPSHILVYDRHNQLLLADTLPSFALYPGSMGSNCEESHDTVQNLMRTALCVTATTSDEYSAGRNDSYSGITIGRVGKKSRNSIPSVVKRGDSSVGA
jgi:hypothetical protein